MTEHSRLLLLRRRASQVGFQSAKQTGKLIGFAIEALAAGPVFVAKFCRVGTVIGNHHDTFEDIFSYRHLLLRRRHVAISIRGESTPEPAPVRGMFGPASANELDASRLHLTWISVAFFRKLRYGERTTLLPEGRSRSVNNGERDGMSLILRPSSSTSRPPGRHKGH